MDKKFSVILIFLLLILGLLVFITFFLNLSKKAKLNQKIDNNIVNLNDKNQDFFEGKPKKSKSPLPLPQIIVDNWTRQDLYSSFPNSLTSFHLKQNFSLDEVTGFSEILSASDSIKQEKNNVFTYNNDKTNSLTFDTKTGNFLYSSKEGISLPENKNIQNSINLFLLRLNLYDNTLRSFTSFQRKSTPGIIYYEVHRDRDIIGAPIFNFIGLANLDEGEKISDLSLMSILKNLPQDKDIYNSFDKRDGFVRYDQFNSITLGIDVQKNKIVYISSNLRPFNNKISSSNNSLITLDQAYQKLKNREEELFLTTPAGQGKINFNTIYPQNKGKLPNAVITETSLVYLESLPDFVQTELVPYYLFRGYGVLDSGYRVNLIAAVSASDQVKGVSTSSILAQEITGTQQQGTFEFTTPSPQPTDIKPSLSPSSSPKIDNIKPSLSPSPQSINPCDDPNLFSYQIGSQTSVFYNGSWIRCNQSTWREIGPDTPSLFVYITPNSSIHLNISADITYSDPPMVANSWQIVNYNNQLTINDLSRQYLYYEYLPIFFETPKNGWLIKKSQLSNLSKNIGNKLKLTDIETERLYFELKQTANKLSDENLQISLIPQDEVDKKLPLSVTHFNGKIYRYHFFIGSRNNDVLIPPILKPIVRQENLIIELGATIY